MNNASLSQYRTVIKCDVDGDGVPEYYEADLLQPVQENISTDIASHPLVTGEILADHMIIQPITTTMTGQFSLNGNKPTQYQGPFGRLANIQSVFEKISKNGLFCDIVVISRVSDSYNDAGKVKFLAREKMALTNISWTRGQNNIGFTFNFTQVLTANVDEVLYNVDVRDPNLPALTEPSTLDFTENYIDYNKIDETVIKMCWDCELVTVEFLEFCITVSDVARMAGIIAGIAGLVITGAIISATISAAVAGTLVSTAAVFPVGTIIAAASAITIGLAMAFAAFARELNKKKYKVETFKKYQTDRENQAEYTRFCNFVGSIHQQIEQLENVISVYGITSSEPQECMLYIDDDYYIFCIERNNVNNTWSLKVEDIEERVVGQQAILTGLSSIYECSSSNMLFITKNTGMFVYVMNTKQYQLAINGAPQSEIDAANDDLSNYQILVSKIKLDDFNQVLTDIIKNSLEA